MADSWFLKKNFGVKFWVLLGLLLPAFLMTHKPVCGQSPLAEFPWKTGPELTLGLESWVSVAILSGDSKNPIRQVCSDLAQTQKVAILLDRRFDPSRTVEVQLPLTGTTWEVLEEIASSQQGSLREVGSAVYFLPKVGSDRFKTLIALRTQELSERAVQGAGNTKVRSQIRNILSQRTYHWDRFQQPRELVVRALKQAGLSLSNAEDIPHDLWSQGILPKSNLVELLSFVLYQYDLTFRWEESAITVVPIPEQVEFKRSHSLTPQMLTEHQEDLRKRYPQAVWTKQGTRWEVVGSEDLHEELNRLRTGKGKASIGRRIRWDNRTFTMKVQQKTLGEILVYLKEAGIPVQYESEQLRKQGFNPDQIIQFEVQEASAQELFRAICQPLNLPFQVTEDGVRIGPASAPVLETDSNPVMDSKSDQNEK